MTFFAKESEFEAAVIHELRQRGWGDAEVIQSPSEADLLANWKRILFENNRGKDRLNEVPLTDGELARSQMPCKVFEAMAMGKPIVASALSDLPEVLDGCGHLVAPGRPDAVAQALETIFGDPAAAREMGERARVRCVERYGAAASRKTLLALLDELK